MDHMKIQIGEREIPLRFRMNEFIQIEEEVGNLGDVKELILSGKNRLRNLVKVTRILGNAGLKHAGKTADLTDEWLTEHMDPYALMEYQTGVLGCLIKESESEAAQEENESTERDLVLEEIQRKKGRVNSHTGA